MEDVILIIGPARCGKDSASRIASELTGFPWNTTSRLALPTMFRVFDAMQLPYVSCEACYEDRKNFRQLWASAMAAMNYADKTGFALYSRAVNEGTRILNGFRRADELLPFVRWLESRNFRVGALWIDASQRLKKCDATMGIAIGEMDVMFRSRWMVVNNNSDEALLAAGVRRSLELLGVACVNKDV